jgi:predicted DNA-binding transcriptional regulator AlpA
MSTKTDPWLSYEDVLADLDVARSTLDDWRRSGRGPIFKRLPNRELRIRSSAYDAWAQALEDA